MVMVVGFLVGERGASAQQILWRARVAVVRNVQNRSAAILRLFR